MKRHITCFCILFCSLSSAFSQSDTIRWGKYLYITTRLTVVEKDSQYAVLNEKMEYVIPFDTYQWISPISVGGLMIVKQNNLYGLLNHQLEVVQPVEFDTISNYPAREHEQNYPSFWAKKNDKYYIFDTLGYWKDGIEYDNIRLLKANFYLVTKDGEIWRADRNGTKIIEDFTIVGIGMGGFVVKKDSLLGFTDIYGNIILPFQYEDIICERLENIFVKKNNKWGVVDDENKQLIPCKYDYIAYAWDGDYEKGRNYIVVQNDKFGKITTDGTEIFPCIYDGITTWVEYGPGGHYVMQGNKMGLINYKGKVLVSIEYEKVEHYWATTWVEIYNNGKVGLYDAKQQKFVLPLEYDCIIIDKDFFGFYENKKPTRIITLKDSVIDILDEQFKILQHNADKEKTEKEYDIKINSGYSLCSYPLSLMKHNRTYSPPECLLEYYKEYDIPTEEIYYKME